MKIMIYEDDQGDLINRYANLTSKHDVYVRYEKREVFDVLIDDWNYDYLARLGFDRSHIQAGFKENPADIDVYFVDGLRDRCFDVIYGLPKKKVFINSGDPFIRSQAIDEGYNVLEEPLEDLIAKLEIEKLMHSKK